MTTPPKPPDVPNKAIALKTVNGITEGAERAIVAMVSRAELLPPLRDGLCSPDVFLGSLDGVPGREGLLISRRVRNGDRAISG